MPFPRCNGISIHQSLAETIPFLDNVIHTGFPSETLSSLPVSLSCNVIDTDFPSNTHDVTMLLADCLPLCSAVTCLKSKIARESWLEL